MVRVRAMGSRFFPGLHFGIEAGDRFFHLGIRGPEVRRGIPRRGISIPIPITRRGWIRFRRWFNGLPKEPRRYSCWIPVVALLYFAATGWLR